MKQNLLVAPAIAMVIFLAKVAQSTSTSAAVTPQ
jgi:hypothetical protein